MSKDANQRQRFIYDRRTKAKIPCTEEQFHAYYDEACRIRKKEQYHKRCMCPKQYIWACDGDCLICEHHAAGDTLSADAENPETGFSIMDQSEVDNCFEEVMLDSIVLKQLFEKLDTLMPNARKIGELRMDGLSDFEIAKIIGVPRTTFLSQLKKLKATLAEDYPDFL